MMTSTGAGTGTCNNDGGIILCNLFQKPCASSSEFSYAGTEVESYARSGHPFFPSGQAETTGLD
jgi:hypothetical protein